MLPPGWEGEMPTIAWYTRTNFCFPIKVKSGKKIVGIGTTILHNGTAWLAHIIVHPGYRKRGIGRLITQTLVDTAYSKGCETIHLLATEPGEPLYRSIGFETETAYLIFKCEGADSTLKHAGNIVAIDSGFKKQIINLDIQVSGEDRASLLEPHLLNGFLYLQDKEVKGFYLPDLGDGLIIATTSLAGQELMRLRFRSKDYAAFPIDNLSAGEFMRDNNFHEFRTEKRMRLGKKSAWQPENIYAIIGGNLG